MGLWPPRADEVFKCLWQMFQQCTQCNQIPVGICSSVTLPTEEQNLPLPVGICSSITLPTGICTVVSGGVEITDPLPLPVGICTVVETPVREQNLPLPVGICTAVETPVREQNLPLPVGICTAVETPVREQNLPLPVGICNVVGISPTVQVPVGICESVCLKLDSRKEIHELFGTVGTCVAINTIAHSSSIELEDVSDIAFTVQRFAGHCGLSVYADLQTSPDDINWDTCSYAGFTNLWFGRDPGLTAQSTLPITVGPKYIRAEIENESFADITIRAWLTLTKTC